MFDVYGNLIPKQYENKTPNVSTGICGRITYGYGDLDEYGYWEYTVRVEDAHLVDNRAICPQGDYYLEYDATVGCCVRKEVDKTGVK